MGRFSRISLFAWNAVCNGGFAETGACRRFWTIAQTIAHPRADGYRVDHGQGAQSHPLTTQSRICEQKNRIVGEAAHEVGQMTLGVAVELTALIADGSEASTEFAPAPERASAR